jgi:hypothetical protein
LKDERLIFNKLSNPKEYLQLHNVTFRKIRWYIGKEIRNMFQKVFDYYLKFQNESEKKSIE